VDEMVSVKEQQIILEYLQNASPLSGADIMKFRRIMKEKRIFH
jgi:hypothetical protein